MLRPILRNDGVNSSERQLSKLLNDTFLSLWSYIGPYSDEGISKNKQGKEICDALVVFGNKIIIFSDKEIKFNTDKPIEVAWQRWYRKSVSDSAKQLYGAEDWIRKYPNRIFLDKDCEELFPLNFSSKNLEIHLIAITKNTLEPVINYFSKLGQRSSGTFNQLFKFTQEKILNTPFTIGDLNCNKTYVHVFDEYSIDLVIKETGTIVDFLHYLSVKEKLIRKYNLTGASGEENFLGFYLNHDPALLAKNKFNYEIVEEIKDTNDGVFYISENEWDEYNNSNIYHIRKMIHQKNKLWSELLNRFTEGIVTAQVGEGADLELATHEVAVRTLASENIVSRALLSDAFQEKFIHVPHNRCSARIVETTLQRDLLYIFLLLPFDSKESSEEYVLRRNKYANAYGLVSKYLYPKYTKIAVLVTQPQETVGRNEAIYLLGFTTSLSYDGKKKAQKIQKQLGILREFTDYNDLSRNHEGKLKVKIGRNDKCHCGSDAKYKKCCLSRDELNGSIYT